MNHSTVDDILPISFCMFSSWRVVERIFLVHHETKGHQFCCLYSLKLRIGFWVSILCFLQEQNTVHVYPDWAAMQVSCSVNDLWVSYLNYIQHPLLDLNFKLYTIIKFEQLLTMLEDFFRHIMVQELLCHHISTQLLHLGIRLPLICGDLHR